MTRASRWAVAAMLTVGAACTGSVDGEPSSHASAPEHDHAAHDYEVGARDDDQDLSLEVEASLAVDCVSPEGTQVLTVSAEPGSTISYRAMYAGGDRSDVDGEGDEEGEAEVDAGGEATAEWAVPDESRAGRAVVTVHATDASGRSGASVVTFSVADDEGACPTPPTFLTDI